MRHVSITAAAAVLALAALPAGAGSDTDKAEEYVLEAETKELHEAPLHGVEGKQVVVKEFLVPPGFETERHSHTGPVFVYVVEGEIAVETEEGTETISAGSLYPEPIDVVMVGRNLSAEAPARIVMFQINDAGDGMMEKAE